MNIKRLIYNINIMDILIFNLFNYILDIKEINNILNEQNIKPDIILTQEDKNKSNNMFNNYILVVKNGLSHCSETVGLYCSNNIIKNNINNILLLHTTPKCLGMTRRNFIIFNINKFDKNIKIANIHLEGGKYIDGVLLKSNFNDYLNYKMEILKYLIEYEKPDIICGDFNSIYHHDNKIYKEHIEYQIKYFKNIYPRLSNEDIDKIIIWNKEPYNYLIENDYYNPYIDYDITSHCGLNIIDCFWIKKSLNLNTKVKVINIDKKISDHNPVLLSII